MEQVKIDVHFKLMIVADGVFPKLPGYGSCWIAAARQRRLVADNSSAGWAGKPNRNLVSHTIRWGSLRSPPTYELIALEKYANIHKQTTLL